MSLQIARGVIKTEINALRTVAKNLGPSFSKACRLMLKSKGRVITTGIGKAGYIAMKTSATMASTGTTSTYLHPTEAYHGDLGRLTKNDILLAFSYSGETNELVGLVPLVKRLGVATVSVTATDSNTLAKLCDINIATGKVKEACSLGLAPTSSAMAMLAIGDSLAVVLARSKRFREEDFAAFHPGGALGKRFLRVMDVMRKPPSVPVVRPTAKVRSVLEDIIRKKAGAAVITDGKRRIIGIFTDGDLRRQSLKDARVLDRDIAEVMTKRPLVMNPKLYLYQAAGIFRAKKVDEIPVADEHGTFLGLMDIQDIISAGL